jgi:beta-lactamase regulating signal transducer with metallopeptidase domain
MNPFAIAGTFSWMLAAFHAFAQAAAPAAVAALWQGIAVAAALAVCLRLAPRISAAHRFTAWTAGFAVLAALQLLPLLPHFASEAAVGIAPALSGAAAHPWLELDARWSLGLAGLWIALAVLRAADLFLHSLRLRRLWKSAVPVEDRFGSLAATPQGRRMQICTTRELDRPSVIGFFAPRILIPDWLYARLTPGELEQVVLHEAEHLRRRDDWTNLLQKFCLVLFPLNPALAWMERRLCREREMACDEGVVRMTKAPRAYAACLASLAERGLQRRSEALSLSAFERRPELVHRVHSILGRKRVLNPLGARALLGVVGCGLLLGSIELARCPQMVAFVPTRAVAAAAQTAQADWAQPLPAAYTPVREPARTRGAAGFRASNVEAILPANPRRPAFARPTRRNAARAEDATTTELSGFASSAPREQLLKAEVPAAATALAHEAQPQEWVVLTSWQVQTSAPAAGEAADYDAGAKPSGMEHDAESRPSEPANRITVTRLILTVYPANPDARSAQAKQAGSVPRPVSSSSSRSVTKTLLSRPAMLPFDSGWLVIQL